MLETLSLDEGDAPAPEAAATAIAAGLWRRRAGERACVAPGAYAAADDGEGDAEGGRDGGAVECAPR